MKAVLVVLLSSGALLNGPVTVRSHWHDDVQQVMRRIAHPEDDTRDDDADCYITPGDVRVINEYYVQRNRHVPFALQRRLRRTAHLPADWVKRVEALPVMVDRQLTTLPRGLRRDLLDGNLVVFDAGTEVVVDAVALFDVQTSYN